MSALKSHSPAGIAPAHMVVEALPAHMVVEALDTRLDMDIKTNGGGSGICNISGHCDW